MRSTILSVIVALVLGIITSCQTSDKTADQPNILFIFADDWGWGDLSCHGHPYVKTPNIDRLALEGTDFYHFTVASGVCSPSRTGVLTGQFPARHKVDGHFAWVEDNQRRNMPDWVNPDTHTLPKMLQSAGYATAHFGKWHLSNDMVPDSPLPNVYGFDEYGAFNCAGEQMPYFEDAMNTIAFIEKSVEAGKPFFINLWVHEPHTPFHTLPEYEWRFRHMESREDQIYASVLSHADDRIGQVLATLDRLELTENTLVIFSSDNGPARSVGNAKLSLYYDTATGAGWSGAASKGTTGGRKGYKASLFQGGIGVPFIARWPGKIAAGKTDEVSLISAVDLLPTFCELAGVELPSEYKPDGISQVATLLGKPYPQREIPLFWKFESPWPAQDSRPDHWVSYAIMDQDLKLLANKDLSYCELYDLGADPYEQKNIKEENPELVKQLLDKITDWQNTLPQEADPSCFSSERQEIAD